MKFELQHTDTLTSARAGVLTTDHGPIETPVFMPVGTVGSVKAVHPWELKEDIKAQIIWGIPIICTCVPELKYWAKREVCISSTVSTVLF